MTRHQMRESAFLLVFERLFSTDSLGDTLALAKENETVPLNGQVESLLRGVEEHQAEIDHVIEQHLHKWKFSRISKVSLAVLRVAVYELHYVDDMADDVVISEAVKIAQDYTSKEDVAFINGLLSAVLKGGNTAPSTESDQVATATVTSQDTATSGVPDASAATATSAATSMSAAAGTSADADASPDATIR